eukprot:618569-Lingulodinium_polyedra.AAC.1
MVVRDDVVMIPHWPFRLALRLDQAEMVTVLCPVPRLPVQPPVGLPKEGPVWGPRPRAWHAWACSVAQRWRDDPGCRPELRRQVLADVDR